MSTPLRLVVERNHSTTWDIPSLRRLLNRTPINPQLEIIQNRRRELARLSPRALHDSYSKELTKENGGKVTPRQISLPPRYGKILYMLASRSHAKVILEAGSGFGISSMYLALAAQNTGGKLLSYEIASYARIAAASVKLVSDTAEIHNADFDGFGMSIDATCLVDFCFIDARHEDNSLVRSFRNIRGWMSDHSMIVVDDIGYSGDSRAGWQHIAEAGTEFGFVATINDRFGLMAT